MRASTKALKLIAISSGGAVVLIYSSQIMNKTSIGIIGGADGPTAIYVSSKILPQWFYLLGLSVLTCLVSSVLLWKRMRKRKE